MNELAKIYTDKTIVYPPEYEDALKESQWKFFIEPGDFLLKPEMSSTNDYWGFCYKITSVEILPKTEGYRAENKEWLQRVVEGVFTVKVLGNKYNPFTKKYEERVSYIESEYYGKCFVFKSITELEEHLDLGNKFLYEGLDLNQHFKVNYSDNDNLPVSLGSKDTYLVMEKGLQNTKLEIEKVKATVAAIIVHKKIELERIKEKFNETLVILNKQILRVQRVIQQIELYLGVEEELIQIQEGMPAPENEVIQFFQEVLYMDEELGDWKDQGIDFKRIEEFDSWLCKNNNINIFCSPKSVRVFRVRREEKRGAYNPFTRTYNPYARVALEEENARTYIIIRNGENIYRIWANIKIHPNLFPHQNELQKYITAAMEEKEVSRYTSSQDSLEGFVHQYKSNIILLQGLFDRADVFKPCPPVNLFSEDFEGIKEVRFVYDNEYKKLPDTRVGFWMFHERVNSLISEGSRVVVGRNMSRQDLDSRFDARYSSYRGTPNYPDTPNEGLYQVFLREGREDEMSIRYNPGDTVWNGYYSSERKVRVSFNIYKSDRWILNFDQVTLDDIEFYLNSRINRISYLDMLPVLEEIRKHLIEEQKLENQFKLMLKGEYQNKLARCEFFIDHYIKWWKTKNKWKRAVTSDDSKAYRMIKRELDKLNS